MGASVRVVTGVLLPKITLGNSRTHLRGDIRCKPTFIAAIHRTNRNCADLHERTSAAVVSLDHGSS